jgi:hypothetical protein
MAESKQTPAKVAQSGQVQQVSKFQRFVEQVQGEADLTKTMHSSGDIAAEIAAKMIEADSLEEAIAAQDSGIPSGRDLVDVEMSVLDFDTLPADEQYKEGSPLGVYLDIKAVQLENGEELRFRTGATNIVTLLHKARQVDRLPLDCVIRSKVTGGGELLTLKLLPKRVIRGQ